MSLNRSLFYSCFRQWHFTTHYWPLVHCSNASQTSIFHPFIFYWIVRLLATSQKCHERVSSRPLPNRDAVRCPSGGISNVDQHQELQRSKFTNRIFRLRGQKCSILLDTGSSVNVLPETELKKLRMSISTDLSEKQNHARACNRANRQVLDRLRLRLTLGRGRQKRVFLVRRVFKVILGLLRSSDLAMNIDSTRVRKTKETSAL